MRRVGKCAACAAKDVTIRVLADQVDWHRQQIGLTAASAAHAAEPPRPRYVERPRQHMLEDEEDVLAALENNAIDTAEAERMLAGLQALNANIEVQ